ncbi:MAG: hypothetical protein J1F71_04750 [Clostridiales bacterium]|nr:hypothetical protein [Clostridiales bacterium]
MNGELLGRLIDSGYADEAGLAAEAVNSDGKLYYLCVSGEIVTLADAETNEIKKVFSDSIDKLTELTVSGIFGKKICFTHGGTHYALKLKGNGKKQIVDYFKMIG